MPETTYWDVIEWQGKNVVTTLYQKQFPSSYDRVSCSPDCKHILWQSREQKKTFLEKKIVPSTVIRWLITDIDGSNERTIGIVPIEMQKESNLSLEWTPDGKGVHFVQNGKLWYLAVP